MPFSSQPAIFNFEGGDDLDDEERERVMKAEQLRQEQMRDLYLKQEEEAKQKQLKKTAAREQLVKWQQERNK